MPSRKAQLVSPLAGEYLSVPGISVTGVITATGGITGVVGVAQSIADGADLDLGTVTGTTFVGDSIGTYRAAGLTNTGAGTSNLNVGVVTATSISGVVTGNITGTASSIISGSDLTVGVATAVTWLGDGSGITGAGSSAFIGQAVTAQAGTTTIDLSSGNIINFTHSNNTTVAFANTTTADRVTFIRTLTANTLTWPNSIKWNNGVTPTLISNARAEAVQVFNLTTTDAGVTWHGWESINNDPDYLYLYTWGQGVQGVQGQDSQVDISSPTQIPGKWVSSAGNQLGYGHNDQATMALQADGALFSWGYNFYGGLGHNIGGNAGGGALSSPTQIPGTWSSWSMGAQGSTIATKPDGTLWVWGRNATGQLGLTDVNNRSSPVQMAAIGTPWATGDSTKIITSICSGAVTDSGQLFVWGYNNFGGLGQNDQVARSSAVQIPGIWKTIDAEYTAMGGLKTNGTLWMWGDDSFRGLLGQNGPNIPRSSPIQVGTEGTWTRFTFGNTTAFGIKTNGTLWSWGYNSAPSGWGQLGLNDTLDRSSPTQIGAGNDWSQVVSTRSYNVAALKTNGSLWVWGNGSYYGSLGLNDSTPTGPMISSPTQIPGTWFGLMNQARGYKALKSP